MGMGELPVDIMYDIMSRMPVKSLDRFRCVSKQWCKHIDEPNLAIIQMNRAIEEPIPVMYKMNPDDGPILVTLFRITESKQDEAKKGSVLEFECENPDYKYNVSVSGSCNGLLYLSRYTNFCETTLSVIHPLRNERYELPPVKAMQSCGLGFDASTNTFKMCVSVFKADNNSIHTMVHVLGKEDSWREIPQIPCYKMLGDGVFAHGCLHWLGYHKQLPFIILRSDMPLPPNHRKKVIHFDVSKEEFGLIDTPRNTGDDWIEMNLVDLHGEVGLVYINRHSFIMELWVLKQNNQWVIHCRFDGKPPLPSEWIDIVGVWNKSGDILVTADSGKQLFVYSLKSKGFHQVNLVGWEDGCETYIHMYRSSLFSIHGMKRKPGSNPTVSSKEKTRKRRRKIRFPFLHLYLSSLFSIHGMKKKPGSKPTVSYKEKTRKRRRKTSINQN